METEKFNKIVDSHGNMLRAAMMGLGSGKVVWYDAVLDGTEVVVLGYQFTAKDGAQLTKPLFIAVDEAVFDCLEVKTEKGLYRGSKPVNA